MELSKPLITLEFRLTLEDFLETVRLREPQPRKVVRLILTTVGLFLVTALLGAPFIMKDVPGFLVAFLFGVLPLAVLMVILPWYYKPDRFYRAYYRKFVFNLCQYDIAEEGIRMKSDTTDSVLLWKAFSDGMESKTQLVLTSGMVQYIFPLHAIGQEKFTELLKFVKSKILVTTGSFLPLLTLIV